MQVKSKVFRLIGVTLAVLLVAGLGALTPAAYGQTKGQDYAWQTLIRGGSHLGAAIRDVEPADVQRHKLPSASGAIIQDVVKDGPAERAGLRAGDVVIRFDNETVRSARQLERLINETPDGREVAATVIRDGDRVELKVTPSSAASRFGPLYALRQNRPDAPFTKFYEFATPRPLLDSKAFALRDGRFSWILGDRRVRLGVSVQDLTHQLAEYFGATAGALVTEVDDNTPGKTAGLRAGDVITKVNDDTVRNGDDLRRELARVSGEITLTVVRDKKEMTLKTKLDDEPREVIRRR